MAQRICTTTCLVVVGLVTVMSMNGIAQDRDRWTRLGERSVTDRLEHDTIVVTGARGDFRAIQLRVKGVGIQFHDVKVYFRSGGVQDLTVRDVIPAGGRSRAIDLRGGDRVITKIEFWYDAQSILGRKATVEVYGLK
jgi:hypothetical protein